MRIKTVDCFAPLEDEMTPLKKFKHEVDDALESVFGCRSSNACLPAHTGQQGTDDGEDNKENSQW